jgi:2-methylcitrate dehydratase PrpD
MKSANPTATLAAFAANLRYDDLPESVVTKTEELMADWLASAVAGCTARPVQAITRFALAMGPASGPSEVIGTGRSSSPMLAAMSNAAASHFVEQDDVHNGSVFHAATVVFPAAVAA